MLFYSRPASQRLTRGTAETLIESFLGELGLWHTEHGLPRKDSAQSEDTPTSGILQSIGNWGHRANSVTQISFNPHIRSDL